MADSKTTIQQLKNHMAEFLTERDWHQFHSPKNLAMGLAIETAELMEHFHWMELQESRDLKEDADRMQEIREEVADCLSYVLCLALSMDLDLSDDFYAKIIKNKQKYPAETYKGKYRL